MGKDYQPASPRASAGRHLPIEFVCARARRPGNTKDLLFLRVSGFTRTKHGCFMSIATMASECRSTTRAVRDALAKLLREEELITTQEDVHGLLTTCYRVHPRLLTEEQLDPASTAEHE